MVRYRIGIDIGGTFTDFLVVSDGGKRLNHKVSSTPGNPSDGVLNGLREIAAILELGPHDFLGSVDVIVHGTTVATNALLTRNGARVGLVCTKGFRDVLTFRDGKREEVYDNRVQAPVPLVPRHRRVGVSERVDSAGVERQPLSEADVRAAADYFQSEGVDALAICLMHAPANSAHEQEASRLLREFMPGVYQTVSTELLPQIRYYDRTSTTVVNSYVGPIMSRYLGALTRDLEEAGFDGVLLVMQSNGGVSTPQEVGREAARAVLSGPASGPTSALATIAPQGLHDCITIDMGGTSFDAALVKDGIPDVTTDGVIDRWRLALPTVAIHTIGAGGGSIARVGENGLLQVGPQSAGASPGPACYGRGGTNATVTDADLVLGYLDPKSFLEGRMELDLDAAKRAIERDVAVPLGLDVALAASGIFNVVNVKMATGIREISVRRGLDARDFPLVVAGGAGPVHATAIASELDTPVMIVPRESSIFCAAGMLLSDFKHDYAMSKKVRLGGADPAELEEIWAGMVERGVSTLRREGLGEDAVTFAPSLDMRYVGQWWELTVPVPASVIEAADLELMAREFHDLHERLFGYQTAEMPVEILTVRLTVTGRTPKPPVHGEMAAGAGSTRAHLHDRPIWSPQAGDFVDAAVFDGRLMSAGAEIRGPAIVELGTSTIVVLDGYDVRVSADGSFVIHATVGFTPEAVEAGAQSSIAK